MAREFIKLGAYLGIGGVVTFKNGVKLQEVVKNIDLKYLLLETDSPYLSPEPYRSCQNIPYNVYYVASKIAEIKGISTDEVIKETNNNAARLFDL
jgi:TatD DNase family protein